MIPDKRRHGDPYIPAGLFLAVVLFVMYVYPGFLIPLSPHFEGSCKSMPLQMSAGDLRIDPTNGLAYLTYYDSVDVRTKRRVPPSTTGTVMLVDLNAAEPHVRAALSSDPPGFKPAGLSLYVNPNGTKRLFVTSRSELGKHTVEIFDQSPTGAFTPAETIRDPLLWSPTAIVAVGPRQFYVVNQLGFRRSTEDGRRANTARDLRGNQSTVVYYDGEHMTIMASGLNLASGIGISPDGRTVYVSESAGGRIQVFDRDPEGGTLKQGMEIDVPGAPHNITVDAEGTLWVSSHPHSVPFMEFVQDPSEHAPTEVLRITPSAAPEKQVEELYVDEGDEISAGSVAAPRGSGQFVVGSRSDHKLLLCTQSASAKPKQT